MSGISQSRLREKEASRLEAEATQAVREKLAVASVQADAHESLTAAAAAAAAQLDELRASLEASEQRAEELQARLAELQALSAVRDNVHEQVTQELRNQLDRVVGGRDEALQKLDAERTRADRAEGGLAAMKERSDRSEAALAELRSVRAGEPPAQNEGHEPRKKASKAGGEG